MDIVQYLRQLVQQDGTDLYFSANASPHIRVAGVMQPMGEERLGPGQIGKLAYSIMNDSQVQAFETTMDCNLALSINALGRFRVNVFRQRGDVAMVVRHIRGDVPPIDDLRLPALLKDLIMGDSGLLLVVGPAGSGISTTIASMIDYRNANLEGHILTIEDRVDYLHRNRKSIVNQREIGIDAVSYRSAMENALRESPDVIMLGELRDADFVRQALAYAESGSLCVSSLCATSVGHALERLASFFPADEHPRLFTDLSLHLSAVLSQRQVRAVTGFRIPVIESLAPQEVVRRLLKTGNLSELADLMRTGEEQGLVSLDQALATLFNEGRISRDEALVHATEPNMLKQALLN